MPLTQPSRAADEQIFPGKIQRRDCHRMGRSQAAEGMVSDMRRRSGRSRFGGESTQGGAYGHRTTAVRRTIFPGKMLRGDYLLVGFAANGKKPNRGRGGRLSACGTVVPNGDLIGGNPDNVAVLPSSDWVAEPLVHEQCLLNRFANGSLDGISLR
jgi:hypothetical protein